MSEFQIFLAIAASFIFSIVYSSFCNHMERKEMEKKIQTLEERLEKLSI